MEGIERIHELMEQIAVEVKNLFGDLSFMKTNLVVENDGYRSITVYRIVRDDELPVEAWKRRDLFDQYRLVGGEWTEDSSDTQNDYYRKNKVLLELIEEG